MQVVSGLAVNDHYWALSYSWNQSGDIICKGDDDYERIDQGKHRIITHKLSTLSMSDYYSDVETSDAKNKSARFVTFEGLIRKICLDFDIKYIWYDRMCIDQSSEEAKLHEIRKMHLIYKSAFCTVALVPELTYTGECRHHFPFTNIDVLSESQWSKRMWTLEETYMSRNIVFVGRNVHLCSSEVIPLGSGKGQAFIDAIVDIKKKQWRACTVLWYARIRTSSKAHDQVFALANIFPEYKDDIDFNYHQPVCDLALKFYRLLAQNDHSILAFGTPIDTDADDELSKTRRNVASTLPSWTGINGAHVPQVDFYYEHAQASFHYTITEKCMHLTSQSIPACIKEENDSVVSFGTLFNDRDQYTQGDRPEFILATRLPIGKRQTQELIFAPTVNEPQIYNNGALLTGIKATHILAVKDENQVAVNTLVDPTHVGGFLSLTESSSECIILSGLDGKYNLKEDVHHKLTDQEGSITDRVTYDGILQQICWDFDIDYLWYGKICIDQTHKEEKRCKIKQMHRIDSNSRFTIALVPEVNIGDPKDFEREN
ncbi:hypothetical protein BJV82DRAFT_670871 [Fennellomyces sp. T-0311]|nr:hypothetical protein BJV82DRAFT_670871 [Fennellomyces sp. T-0311]